METWLNSELIKEYPLKLTKETLSLASNKIVQNLSLKQSVKIGLISTAFSFSIYYLQTRLNGPITPMIENAQQIINSVHQKVTVDGEIDLSGNDLLEVLRLIYRHQYIAKDQSFATSSNVVKLLEIMSVCCAAIRSTYENQDTKNAPRHDIKLLFNYLQGENTVSISIQIISQLLLNMKKDDIPINRIVSFCKSQFTPIVFSEMICLSLSILTINRPDCYQLLIDSGVIVVFEFLISKHLKDNIPTIKYAMLKLIGANGPTSKNTQALPQAIIDKYYSQARWRYYISYGLQHQKLPAITTFLQMAAYGSLIKKQTQPSEYIGIPILLIGGMSTVSSLFGMVNKRVSSQNGSLVVNTLTGGLMMTCGYGLVKCTSIQFTFIFASATMISYLISNNRDSSGFTNIKPFIYPEEIIEYEKRKEIKKRVMKDIQEQEIIDNSEL